MGARHGRMRSGAGQFFEAITLSVLIRGVS